MDKKGQGGLSMNTIIIAIIGIIVLLLIVTFFTGGMSTVFTKITNVFEGGTKGYDVDLTKAQCKSYCQRENKDLFCAKVIGPDKDNCKDIDVDCAKITC